MHAHLLRQNFSRNYSSIRGGPLFFLKIVKGVLRTQYFITWFSIAVRQEDKLIDNSVVVHELELAIKRDLLGVL